VVWLFMFTWTLFVNEIVEVDDSGVAVRLRIGLIPASRRRFYSAADIRNVSVQTKKSRAKGHSFTTRHLILEGPGWSGGTRFTTFSDADANTILNGPMARFVRRDSWPSP